MKLKIFIYLLTLSSSYYSQCDTCNKVIFVLDASNSMDSIEFYSAKNTIEKLSKLILINKNNSVGVVQYATYFSSDTTLHKYNVTVPFTKNFTNISNFVRDYKYGDTTAPYGDSLIMDHLPGSLAEMRIDSIWDSGKQLDLVTDSCKVNFFFFTDVNGQGSPSYCCSHLKNNYGKAPSAYLDYGEYNWLKTTYKITSSVLHSVPSTLPHFLQGFNSCGAIASVGGQNYNFIDTNLGDPEGWITKPRLFYPNYPRFRLNNSFYRDDTLIHRMLNNISISTDIIISDSVCFGDSSTLSTTFDLSTVSSFVWNFGDGFFDSTTLSPKHYYSSPGLYTVTIQYNLPSSICVDTLRKKIVVFPSINSNYLFDTVCLGDSTNFIAQTTDSFNQVIWNFGDGFFSYSFPMSNHTYSSSGNYNTSLTLKKSSSCKNTSINTIIVESINDTVIQSNDTLYSIETGATFQWMNYNISTGYSILPMETFSYFIPRKTGIYCVEIKKGHCVDTTWCKRITITNVEEETAFNSLSIYPNPLMRVLNIEFDKRGNYNLFSIEGKHVLQNGRLHNNITRLDISGLEKGMYLLRVTTSDENVITKRVIKL